MAAEGGGGGESLYERAQRERLEVRKGVEADPFVRSMLDAFPGAEIVGIRTLQIEAQATPADGDQAPDEED